MLTAEVQSAVMQPGANVTAWQQGAGGEPMPLQLLQTAPGQWAVSLSDGNLPGFVKMSGTSRLGNLIEHTVGPLSPPGIVLPPPVVETPPAPEPIVEAPVEEIVVAAPAETQAEPEADGGWLIPAIVFGVFNLVLLVGVGVWFFLVRKRGAESDDLDLDQLIEAQVAAPESDSGQVREDAA